jgi:hypothetical protein
MSFGKDSNNILISRDGPALQFITLETATHEKAFEKIKEVSDGSMLPSELAELTIALIKTQQNSTSVEVVENKPIVISGNDGFRLHVSFENQKGLNYEGVIYGVADNEKVFLLSFYATQIHYFPRDLPVFEKLVSSFRLT